MSGGMPGAAAVLCIGRGKGMNRNAGLCNSGKGDLSEPERETRAARRKPGQCDRGGFCP